MKKIILLILALIILTFPACSGGGADITDTEAETETETLVPVHKLDCETIDQATASKIKTAYFNYITRYGADKVAIEDFFIMSYFGNYSGCDICEMGGIFDTDFMPETYYIAGYGIRLDEIDFIIVYKDGLIYNLETAYANGLLTKQDIYNFGTKVNADFTERYPEP